MTTPTGDRPSLRELEITVRTELILAEAGQPEEQAGDGPADEWPDPDTERYEVALRTLLGAVEAVEDASRPGEPRLGTQAEGS